MDKNKLLNINGTSSSGKTSIANKYLEIAPEVYYHVSLDMIASMINEKHIDANIDEIASITHETVKLILKHGSNVVLDTVFEDNYSHWVKECLEMFQDYDVRLIKISCGINELKRRELSRNDREIGLADYGRYLVR